MESPNVMIAGTWSEKETEISKELKKKNVRASLSMKEQKISCNYIKTAALELPGSASFIVESGKIKTK